MEDHIYRVIHVVGSSTTTLDEAVRNAIARAAKTIRQMRWFEVAEIRGNIDHDHIAHWQVTVKIGFTLEE